MMTNGFYISPAVVRVTVGLITAAVITVLVMEFPTMRRYLKIESM